MKRTSPRRRVAIAAGGATAALVGALVAWMLVGGSGTHAPARAPATVTADELLPGDTLTDWVTYGDALVRVVVEEQNVLATSEDDVESAYIPRGLTVRINNVLWTRPGADLAAPRSVDFTLDGWTATHGERVLMRVSNEPVLAAGHEYVMLLTRLVPSKRVRLAGWIPTNTAAIVPVKNDLLNVSDQALEDSDKSETPSDTVRRSVTGKSPADLVADLQGTNVDDSARSCMPLAPDERLACASQ